MKLPTIGVVGGVGPLAGATLVQKIYEDSGACYDQAQPRVLLASYPSEIPDRTTYLLGGSDTNPSVGLRRVLRDLKAGGATVAGIACVTAHAEPIFADIRAQHFRRARAGFAEQLGQPHFLVIQRSGGGGLGRTDEKGR